MIFQIFITILILSAILAGICQFIYDKEGDVYINPVVGFMVGVLKSEEKQELINSKTEELVGYQIEYTFQVCLFFISCTFVWVERANH